MCIPLRSRAPQCASYHDYIIVGSSHASRLAAALTQQGKSVTCLASPSWRLTAENIASTSMSLEDAVRANPSAIVIFQMLDSSIYFSSSEEGEITLPKRAADGRYHVPGELVLADWSALKKIFTTSLSLIWAGGTNSLGTLTPNVVIPSPTSPILVGKPTPREWASSWPTFTAGWTI